MSLDPKGYVPALVIDSGETLTENIAVLDWLATQYPALSVSGELGRTRLLEALTFLSTEIHRSFKAFWHESSEAQKESARAAITGQFQMLVNSDDRPYLLGQTPSVADFYLFVMLLWARRFAVTVPQNLQALESRIASRPSTQTAMRAEGLL